MTPAELSALVRAQVAAAIEAGEFTGAAPAEVVVERPKNPEHGDYSTNVALRLAKPAGKPAREVADREEQTFRSRLRSHSCGSSADSSRPCRRIDRMQRLVDKDGLFRAGSHQTTPPASRRWDLA